MIRFDAYTATSEAIQARDAVALLADTVCGFDVTLHQGKGFHRFAERVAVRVRGHEIGAVQWGGSHGEKVMIEVKGDCTPAAVERLRGDFPHRCTRVDSCADFDAPRAFESLYRACRRVKKHHNIIGGKAGDWEDFPEKGRTLYLGAKTSTTRMRLYEKGKQPEYAHLDRPNWTRIEVQVRPVKEAKAVFSTLSPVEVWGASKWSRDIAAEVLKEHVDPHPAGTTYRLSQRDTALRFMCRQYGAHLVSLAEDLGGWDCVGLTLGEMLKPSRY